MKKENILILVLVGCIAIAGAICGHYIYENTVEKVEETTEETTESYGNLHDLEIGLYKTKVCLDKEKPDDYLTFYIYNPTDKIIPIENLTFHIQLDEDLADVAEVIIERPYITFRCRENKILFFKDYFSVDTMLPLMKASFSVAIKIHKWDKPLHAKYNNFLWIGDKSLNFTILTYVPPYRYVLDPNDLDIQFDSVFDFGDIIEGDSVIKNKTITHVLTIYNPTYRNATGLLLSLRLHDDLENANFIVKAGNTFLFYEYVTEHYYDRRCGCWMPTYHIYENMSLDPIPSLGKLEIPVLVSFVKCDGWFREGLIYDCALLLYSGNSCVEIPLVIKT